MADNNKSESFNVDSSSTDNNSATKGKGPQGIDKPPGEETSQENIQFTQETQKGKKVDRDPSQKEEEPLDSQDI